MNNATISYYCVVYKPQVKNVCKPQVRNSNNLLLPATTMIEISRQHTIILEGIPGASKSTIIDYMIEITRKKFPEALIYRNYKDTSSSGFTDELVLKDAAEDGVTFLEKCYGSNRKKYYYDVIRIGYSMVEPVEAFRKSLSLVRNKSAPQLFHFCERTLKSAAEIFVPWHAMRVYAIIKEEEKTIIKDLLDSYKKFTVSVDECDTTNVFWITCDPDTAVKKVLARGRKWEATETGYTIEDAKILAELHNDFFTKCGGYGPKTKLSVVDTTELYRENYEKIMYDTAENLLNQYVYCVY